MPQRFYPLGLHKKEWERLKSQAGPIEPDTTAVNRREEYFNALNELSQKWISHWPDSAEGIKQKLEEQRKDRRKKNKALVEAYRSFKKPDNSEEAVARAKQIIFDGSCYGRQLKSAEYESRALVEREAQIAFKKEIEQKEAELSKDKVYAVSPAVFNIDEKEEKAIRKLAALECVKFNEEMEKAKKYNADKLKEEQIQCESVDDEMIKQFHDAKAKNKAEIKRLNKKEIEEYKAVRKEVEKHRKTSKEHNNALIEVNKREQDRVKCKIAAVQKRLIEESRHGERAIKFYKTIDELQKAEKKKYDDFVEKAIEQHDEKNALQEKKEIEIENQKRAERCKISQDNKTAGENHKLYLKLTAPVNKCVCDVQTLLVKPDSSKASKKKDKKSVLKSDSEKSVEEPTLVKNDDSKKDKLSFLQPNNKLLRALKRREKEPSGYTGTAGADNYFAQQASEAIQRAQHKIFPRRVVDEYLKLNCLKPSDLPILND